MLISICLFKKASFKDNENKTFKVNKNENVTYQIMWEATQAALRGNLVALNAHIREKIKINTPRFKP